MLTLEHLKAICPAAKVGRLALVVEPLNAGMAEFGVNTSARAAAFVAQLAHESASFFYTEEIASGAAYDHRADLGNTMPEAIEVAKRHGTTAGRWFKGHGWIQTTGYFNHVEARDDLGIDCVENPGLLSEPINAARAAGLFWHKRGLNEFADAGNFREITKRVNGGYNGWEDRLAYWERAKKALA